MRVSGESDIARPFSTKAALQPGSARLATGSDRAWYSRRCPMAAFGPRLIFARSFTLDKAELGQGAKPRRKYLEFWAARLKRREREVSPFPYSLQDLLISRGAPASRNEGRIFPDACLAPGNGRYHTQDRRRGSLFSRTSADSTCPPKSLVRCWTIYARGRVTKKYHVDVTWAPVTF